MNSFLPDTIEDVLQNSKKTEHMDLSAQALEECVLGSMIINPHCIPEIVAALSPNDFYVLRHQWIFQAIRDILQEQGEKAAGDYRIIGSTLQQRQQLFDIGGYAYLTQLVNSVPSATYYAVYLETLKNVVTRRKLFIAADTIKGLTLDGNKLTSDVVVEAQRALDSVSVRDYGNSKPLSAIVKEMWDDLDALAGNEQRVLPGIPLTFAPRLTDITSGMQPGEYWLVAAATSVGKSAFAGQVAYDVAKQGRGHVLYISLEMTDKEMGARFMAIESQVNSRRLTNSFFTTEEYRAFVAAAGRISDVNMTICTDVEPTPKHIELECLRVQREYGKLALVVIDQMSLVQSDTRYHDRKAVVDDISSKFKRLFRKMGVTGLVVQQLNKEGSEIDEPQLIHVAESYKLVQDANYVLLLSKDMANHHTQQRYAKALLNLAKSRMGPVAHYSIYHDTHTGTFSETPFKEVKNAKQTGQAIAG